MASDINGTVVAIQGNAVKEETLGSLEDGYVLTWDNTDEQWEAKSAAGLQSQVFTSSSTWTCPANVFNVWLDGFGGGGGGAGGNQPGGGGGGGGSIKVGGVVSVTPGDVYSVTIGAGGSGGTGGDNGNDGDATSFSTIFYAQGAGKGWSMTSAPFSGGGCNIAGASTFAAGPEAGVGAGYNDNGYSSCANWTGNGSYVGGIVGATNDYGGGGGGGAGPGGNGANGGAGHSGVNGGNGASAAANTGAGGGAGGSSDMTGGSGGNGGSGQLTVSWIG